MSNRKNCRVLWPFGLAIVLATLVSFPAWATLNLMELDTDAQFGGAATCSAQQLSWERHSWCRDRR